MKCCTHIDLQCQVCGKTFTASTLGGGARRKYCDACKKDVLRVYNVVHWRIREGIIDKSQREAELARELARRAGKQEQAVETCNTDGQSRRCHYCGGTRMVDRNGYCQTCKQWGYDGIHKVTGRTDGWDQQDAPKREPIKDGWRGMPVIGGCSQRHRYGTN